MNDTYEEASEVFKHYISLGYFCGIASMLEEVGLREASGPFDWMISDFKGVIGAIENNFKDLMNYDLLLQNSEFHKRYMNSLYHFEFYHDFNEYQTLKKQIKKVGKKYKRRIERFYDMITEPTLFIRYISDENKWGAELAYIENNYEHILDVIKSYNVKNEILFVANNTMCSDKIKIYHVQKDENDTVARKPLEKNSELNNTLCNFYYEKRDENRKRYMEKLDKKKKHKLQNWIIFAKNRVKRKFLKDYIHDKQY